jgi:hypothetical protein
MKTRVTNNPTEIRRSSPSRVLNWTFFLPFFLVDRILRAFDFRSNGPANLSLRKCPRVGIRLKLFSNLDAGSLITQNRQGKAVVVTGLCAADLRLSLLQLCLAQLNDGT